MEWWLPKILDRFEIQTIQATHSQAFHVIGHPKTKIEAVDGSKL
jgi:NAD(P)H-nitrite reductase large subunit